MPTAEGITVAPELADMRRGGGVPEDTHLVAPAVHGGGGPEQRGPCDGVAIYLDRHLDDLRHNLLDDLRNDLRDEDTYTQCLVSCVFFFFCHALGVVLLRICGCCSCLTFLVATPEHLVPKNRTQKFFAFFAKNLSKLWVTTLLLLFARWVLFRPFDVKPHLGASTVHEFDLQAAPAAMAGEPGGGAPGLHFNLTAYLLLKNGHNFYKISYNHLAVSVLYADEKLGPVDDRLPSFRQEPHRSTVMQIAFVGRLRNASTTVAETFAGERDKGVLEMVVRIRVTLAYRFWPFKQEYFTIYDCSLSSPFPQIGGEPAVSSPAWCRTMDI